MIPLVDLRAQYRSIKREIADAIDGVLERAEFVLGPEVAAFEREFAAFCGAPYAVAVNSGTSALHLALLAAGVQPGDEVLTVPLTFVATVAAIEYTGARPIFVDVDPETLTMDVSQIERAITPRTRAIVPVHLHGLMADMDAIAAIAGRHGLTIVADAAHAVGAEYRGRRAGSVGDLAGFSFYPSKNLGAYGEGGIVVARREEDAQTLRRLRDWGLERKHHHVQKGFNYRMDALQGAVLRVKLRHLAAWTDRRRAIAAAYDVQLQGFDVRTPATRPDRRHVYHVYAVRSARRDAVQSSLAAAGIQTGIHYPTPVHLQPAFANLGYGAGDFPVAERAASELLSLPMYAEMTADQIDAVVGAVAAALPRAAAIR